MTTFPRTGMSSSAPATDWRVKFKAEGQCRMCGRVCMVRPLTRHHVVPQRWFLREGNHRRLLRNAVENLVPLCRPCHDDCEQTPEGRRLLRRCLSQAEIAFAIRMRGTAWFGGYYPKGAIIVPSKVESARRVAHVGTDSKETPHPRGRLPAPAG